METVIILSYLADSNLSLDLFQSPERTSQRGITPPLGGLCKREPGLPKTGKVMESDSYGTDLNAFSKNPAESGNLSSA